MKVLTISLIAVILGSLSASAQDGGRIFKRFKGDVSMGYAASPGTGFNGGVLFSMEPKYAVMDKLAIGLRMEGAVLASFTGSGIYGNADIDDARAALSFLATADYYFTDNYSFRPLVGGGAGIYGFALESFDEFAKFGGVVRVGAEVKHFRFGIEYNIIPVAYLDSYEYNNGNVVLVKVKNKNSYIGIKAGFCFGGGPR